MSLEGLRAWIGEVERKLGKRTRVFLALTVIAIGLGGAAIYLAIDARESSVSESDVRALQEKLETRIDEVSAGATTPPVEVEPEAEATPAPEGQTPQPENGDRGQGGGGGSTGGASSNSAGEGAAGAVPGIPPGATGGAASSAKLQELLQQAKEKAEASE
ncbi:MAG TPA: hypothetical protein VFN89_00525 [Solirubrobacterales bacterium]|nr:hypothetical protein [Solirubrobacterales bacterium]